MDPKERSAGIAQEALLNKLLRRIRRNEEQLFLVLTLVIGVVVGLTIVAFVVLTERVGLRLYPVGAQPWRRLFMPLVGSVLTG
jgi:CIC family chloride channel protein